MRFALRSLLKSPGFTVIALLTLALGIGVNTSMFTLVDALMFRAAPFPRGGDIHQIIGYTQKDRRYDYSEIETREIRERSSSFSALTTLRFTKSALAEPGRPPEQVTSMLVSAGFFETFGVQPFLGRAFTSEESKPGNDHVIILSHAFWQSRFGGSHEVIGRNLRINSETVTVIGVMPASFDWRLLWGGTAFWRPLNFTPDQLKSRTYRTFLLVGRLKSESTSRQADAELAPVAINQQKDFPRDYAGLTYQAVPLHEAQMDNTSRQILWMLLGLSGFVLLIACANLANLQLARATTSVRDFAIRAALGASRVRLIRQQLTECIMLSLAGGALGLLFALWLNHALNSAITINGQAGGLDLPIDGQILLVTLGIATCTGVIFGIVPALISSRTDVVTSLKSQSRGSTTGRSHHRMRQALIVAEVALALVLLGGAGVMKRGFDRFINKEVGWDKTKLLTGALPMPEARFPDTPARLEFFRKVEARLATIPGVESVALTTGVPVWGYGTERQIFTEKQAGADQANLPRASHVMITPGFFKVLGISVIEGRNFSSDIKPDDPKVIIVNAALARQFWPGQSAVGQRLASRNGDETVWSEVIGVVPNTESAADIGNSRTPYQVFRPIAHEAWSWVRFAIRSDQPAALPETVRRALAEVDPDLPATDVETAIQSIDRSNHNLIVVAGLLGGFAALGLVLAAVGIYGVISNLVAQRTGEFGIRLALGARPADVLGLVLFHGLKLSLLGLVLGMGGAYGLSRLLNFIMPRMVSPDALALAGTAVLLFVVAALACWIPARRATKVDPIVALRAE